MVFGHEERRLVSQLEKNSLFCLRFWIRRTKLFYLCYNFGFCSLRKKIVELDTRYEEQRFMEKENYGLRILKIEDFYNFERLLLVIEEDSGFRLRRKKILDFRFIEKHLWFWVEGSTTECLSLVKKTYILYKKLGYFI